MTRPQCIAEFTSAHTDTSTHMKYRAVRREGKRGGGSGAVLGELLIECSLMKQHPAHHLRAVVPKMACVSVRPWPYACSPMR